MPKKEAKKKFKWGWSDTVIAISVILIALVGLTVYEGTVGKEQAQQQSDEKACKDFNTALGNAYKTTTAKDFYWVLFRGAYAGIDATRDGTDLNQSFVDLAQLEEYVNNTTWNSMLVTVGDATTKVQANCAVVLKVKLNNWSTSVPHATDTPSPTPSATN